MSENNVNGITGADVATTTGIIGATIGIGQYIVNDYVITIAATEGDYGYTMTITRGTETQTVTLYGLTQEQYDAMLGYLRRAQEAAQSAAASSGTASDAATRAETAAGQITGMTAEAVTLAPGSAATASFLDGLLTLGIPAGETGATGAQGDPGPAGETGNGIVSIIKTGTQGNVDTYTITMTDGSTSTFTVTNGTDGAVLSVAGKTGAVTLDAGDVEYDDTDTYAAGSVGAGIANLKSQMEVLEPAATSTDVGKALIAKTVTDGKVTEYEFGEAGGGADIDSIITVEQNLTGADSSNRKMLMQKDSVFETELTARDYRRIGYVNVMRGAVDITKWVYADGEIGVDCAFDDLRVEVIAPNKVPAKTVDICLFTGQSNMSGRGDASQATVCPAGEGYWWHNNQFEQIVDPVGNESVSTGTMIPAICKAYYDTTNVPIVAVVNAIGGTTISYWQPDTGAYNNTVSWVNAAKAYAEQNGYTVRHVMMCWCQGENDVAEGTTKIAYKAAFITMCDGLAEDAGIELFFNIKIGQHKTDASYDFTAIREAQDELCQENPYYINVSDKFRDAPMKDAWHFAQPELNNTGRNAGINMGYYVLTDIKPLISTYNTGDWYDQNVSDVNEFDLNGWLYTTQYGNGLSLNKYTGDKSKIFIPTRTLVDGYITPICLDRVNNEVGFKGNTTIEEVDIAEDVMITQNGNATYQILSSMFNGCTALKKVTSLPSMSASASPANRTAESLYNGCTNVTQVVFPKNVASLYNCCNGCASLTEIPNIPQTCTNLQNAFAGTKLVVLPDIPDSVTTIQGICSGANFNSLTRVGIIGTGVTTMYNAFRYCNNITGVIRIESPNVSNMGNAFSATAIPNITFQVPANSTTYTTLTTKFPTANVETF